jgi:hypothetical protein
MMNWEAAGAIGEIVGAIAVVATLIFLVIQLRHSTQATQNNAWQDITRILSDLNVTEVTDPDLSSFVQQAEIAPSELTEYQYWKFARIAETRIAAFESAFLASSKGTIGTYYWDALLPYALQTMRKPGYVKFWDESKHDVYHPEFINFMDSVMEKREPDKS